MSIAGIDNVRRMQGKVNIGNAEKDTVPGRLPTGFYPYRDEGLRTPV